MYSLNHPILVSLVESEELWYYLFFCFLILLVKCSIDGHKSNECLILYLEKRNYMQANSLISHTSNSGPIHIQCTRPYEMSQHTPKCLSLAYQCHINTSTTLSFFASLGCAWQWFYIRELILIKNDSFLFCIWELILNIWKRLLMAQNFHF